MKALIGVCATVFIAFWVAWVSIAVNANNNRWPNCPAEDSCITDYRDGGWWIQTGDDDAITHEWHPSSGWIRVSN